MALSTLLGTAGIAASFGTASPVSVFDDGHDLSASWIWANTEVKPGQWVAMRKTFVLDSVPEEFIARISADTKYWLWINGEQVIFEGQLKMGDSKYTWYYDKEDLAKHLVRGENVIAVQVFYSGKASGSTINTRVPAFLFDASEGDTAVVSDTSWKAILDLSYEEPIGLNNVRIAEANIKYNANSVPTDAAGNVWTDKDYDDTAWGYAINQDEKIRTNQIYNDENKFIQDTDPRRALVLRSVPQFKVEKIVKYTANGANGTEKWVKQTVYTIKNRSNIQGTPYLKVKSASGGEIISIIPDSWAKGNSSSVACHQYITKAGEQSWEALGWMNGYEISFDIPASVQVLELGFRESGYNTVETGSVITDNEIINQIYREAYDTLYVCMRDGFMDCPDRERTQWWGDAVINMQQAIYAMDANAALLYAKTLKQALGFTRSNGIIPSKLALGRPDLELPMQSLAGVHSFWQYYLYIGDEALIFEAYPILLNYLKLWGVSDMGVITHRSGNWNWYDWGSNCDEVIIENCWYYVALESVLNIARLEGSGATPADIEFLEYRMQLIKKNFDTIYFDHARNAYYNKTDNGKADDRANAMAIYSGLAGKSRYGAILNVLKSTYNAGPYMEKYVLEAMYMMGADDEAISRTLDRFTPFTEYGYPTLPETWIGETLYDGDESRNHAWTGSPLSMLYMYNAGIKSTSAGFKTIEIRPQLGTLSSVSATVEMAVGKILVGVEKSAGGYALAITVPGGVSSAVIYVPRVTAGNNVITLNGTVVYANGIATSIADGISYVGEEEDFVGFSVPAGEYTIISAEAE